MRGGIIFTMNRSRGFTLVELMIAIAIIGIMVGIILPGFSNARKKSRDALRLDNLKSLGQAAELYFAEHSYTFPNSLSDLAPYFTQSVLPKDPQTHGDYLYLKRTNPRGYCIGANLEVVTTGSDCAISGANYTIKGPQ